VGKRRQGVSRWLLKAAPQLKDAVELGQIALKGLGWG
jgi:hypothetical protein